MYQGIPLKIEVLFKKAAVDPEFFEILVHQREKAAEMIELHLTPVELEIVRTCPKELLIQTIRLAKVSMKKRPVFLGNNGPKMLAMLMKSVY